MRAVRVLKRKSGKPVYAVHWLTDDEETTCRRQLDDLQVVEELNLEKLPPLEACGMCLRITDGWTPAPPTNPDRAHVEGFTAAPSAGRVRKTGSLNHGTRVHRGSRLA